MAGDTGNLIGCQSARNYPFLQMLRIHQQVFHTYFLTARGHPN